MQFEYEGDVNEIGGSDKEFAKIVPGAYRFTVLDTEDKTSKAGNAYVKLVLSVEAEDEYGKEKTVKVFDNLFSSQKAAWKVMSILDSVGLKRSNTVETSALNGQTGFGNFKFGEVNDKGHQYLEVKGYITEERYEKVLEVGKKMDTAGTPF